MLGYALVALGLAPLLGGGWPDTVVSVVLSVLVYGIVLLSGRLAPVATEWMPLTTAFAAGLANLAHGLVCLAMQIAGIRKLYLNDASSCVLRTHPLL